MVKPRVRKFTGTDRNRLNYQNGPVFRSPGRSPGRAIVLLPGVGVGVGVGVTVSKKCLSFYVTVFNVIGKALSGELSCPCDRSCSVDFVIFTLISHVFHI